jgi:N-acylneuraminate cytidylyltransferase
MKTVCIIPARGGSKRIPKKNIKTFSGQPIIAYSIENALNSNLFDEVMVSTDDPEVAEIAQKYGANVPFMRSAKTADDYAPTIDVVKEVIDSYSKLGKHFNYACCLYPCAPFVTVELLKKGFELMESEKFDSVFPVVAFAYPIQRALKVAKGSKVEMFNPEHILTRSQDLEKAFHDSGQFYWMNCATILQKNQIITDNSGVIEVSELNSHDIDSPTDWKLAELKYALMHSK